MGKDAKIRETWCIAEISRLFNHATRREEAWSKKKRTKFKITYIFENFGEKISCTLKYIYIEWQRILETEFREIPDEYSRILSDM